MSKRRSVSEEWNLGYEAGVGARVRRALSDRKIEIDKLTAENGMLQNRLRQALERLAATEKELAKMAKAAAKPRDKTPRGKTGGKAKVAQPPASPG